MKGDSGHPDDERGLWFARAWVFLYLALIVLVSLVPAELIFGRIVDATDALGHAPGGAIGLQLASLLKARREA